MPFSLPRAIVLAVVLGLPTFGAVGLPSLLSAPAQAQSTLTIKGEIASQKSIALPADSALVVELREASGSNGTAVAEMRLPLQGKRLPQSFALPVDRSKLNAGRAYSLRASIVSGGHAKWNAEAKSVDLRADSVDVGKLMLHAAKGEDLPSAMRCGDHRVTIDQTPAGLTLRIDGQTYEMQSVATAAGARYEVVGDRSTSLTDKGHGATLVLRGRTLPPCVKAELKGVNLRAKGNDPTWWLDVGDRTVAFYPDGNRTKYEGPTPASTVDGNARSYTLLVDGRSLAVVLVERLCRDSKNNAPFPYEVAVTFDRRSFKGCGGDPALLLQGREWTIDNVDGAKSVVGSRPTVKFEHDGRIAGSTGCNTYVGRFAATIEGLTISGLATTRQACAEPLAAQEKRILELLSGTQSFLIGVDGALILRSRNDRSITARR